MDKMMKIQEKLCLQCQRVFHKISLWFRSINDFENDTKFIEISNQSFNIEEFKRKFDSFDMKIRT